MVCYQVTFGEIRNIDLGTHDPIIYLPTWKNKYGTRLAEMIGSHTAAYTTSNYAKVKDIFGKCYLSLAGASSSSKIGELCLDDFTAIRDEYGATDLSSFNDITLDELKAIMLKV